VCDQMAPLRYINNQSLTGTYPFALLHTNFFLSELPMFEFSVPCLLISGTGEGKERKGHLLAHMIHGTRRTFHEVASFATVKFGISRFSFTV
jgi:hypothetical protein